MRAIVQLVLGAVLTSGIAASASADGIVLLPAPEVVGINAREIFVPPGFDSNDDAQVVLHGEYMNTCYKSAFPEVNVDRERMTITVAPKAYLRTGCWCAPVTVSYTQPVSLGVLRPGKYRVIELGADGAAYRETALSIANPSPGSMEGLLYAPVKFAQVTGGTGARELVLSGTFDSSCTELQEVKVLHRTPKVFEVLPLISYKTGTTCENLTSQPFEARVKLPETEPGNNLVHVRLLSGQSLNLIETF